MIIPFATNSYKSRALPVSAQRCVNMYSEAQPRDAKAPIPIFGHPGITQLSTVSTGPIRAMYNMNEELYVVSGGKFYRVSSTGAVTLLGGTILGSGPVSMSDNGNQIVIVNGAQGYIWSSDSGFQLISSANFHPAKTVTFFDGYFVYDHTDTNQFFISELDDGNLYEFDNFATAEVQSDQVTAVVNQQENLLVFGRRTIETWYDSGEANFPFGRYDGATIERGCIASLSIVKEDNSVFFLGNDKIFYRLNGVIPVRVSTHAIEHAWNTYSTVEDAFAFSYTFEGHKFVVITFPSAPATWVYDISTGLWSERISFDSNSNSFARWRVNAYCNVYGKLMVGDAYSGRIGYIDINTFEEFGNPIIAELVSPVLHNERKRVFVRLFELDAEVGVGAATGQGKNPQIMLNWSRDGGRTWSALQLWTSMGKIGEFNKRLRWFQLGQGYQWVFKVTISDPVNRCIISNNVELEIGSS